MAARASVRSEQVRAVGRRFLRVRPLVVAPFMAGALTILASARAPTAQLVAVAIGMGAMLAFFAGESLWLRRHELTERHLHASLLFTIVGLVFASVATGALGSPVLALLFAPAITALAAFGRRAESARTLVVLGIALVVMAFVPAGHPFPALPTPHLGRIAGLALVAALVLLWLSVAGLTDAYERASDDAVRARELLYEDVSVRLQTLQAFSARVAHEIKNPLTSVKGLVQLLGEETSSPDRAEKRRAVLASEVARIESIVEDYLTFARPVDSLRPARIALRPFLADVVAVIDARAQARGISTRLRVTDTNIEADTARVRDALLNLLANALEASSSGGEISIETEERERTIEIRVRDTGHGMSNDELARVGTAFYTTREKGTGLGVLVARRIAEQHGGALTFESEPGRGTTAILALPRLTS